MQRCNVKDAMAFAHCPSRLQVAFAMLQSLHDDETLIEECNHVKLEK